MPILLRSVALSLVFHAALSSQELARYEAVEPAMGTLFRIVTYAPSETAAREGFNAAFARARELDERLSDYRPESELNRLCRAGRAPVSDDLFEVLRIALAIARTSDGAFDPTLGPFTRLWRESRKSGRLPAAAELREARRRTGWRKVKLDARNRTVTLGVPGMQLDLGGIAKGFAADRMLAVLRGHGLRQSLVAASGDIAAGSAPPGREGWSIEAGGATHVLADRGVSTSGPAEQYVTIGGVRYAHLLDPRTGIGLVNAISVGVIAPSAALADALATACVTLDASGAQRLASRWKAVCLRNKTETEVER